MRPRGAADSVLRDTVLENVNLKRKLSAEEYNRILPGLQLRLYDLEKACWDLKIRSILVFEGWDAAGKAAPSPP